MSQIIQRQIPGKLSGQHSAILAHGHTGQREISPVVCLSSYNNNLIICKKSANVVCIHIHTYMYMYNTLVKESLNSDGQ
jgi:hypothetical protein